MSRKPNRKLEPAAAGDEADDPVPQDIDAFRLELARRIGRFVADRKQYWRSCKQPACRRRRACMAPRVQCSNAPPLPPMSAEQTGRMMARIQRMLRQRLDAMRAEQAASDAGGKR